MLRWFYCEGNSSVSRPGPRSEPSCQGLISPGPLASPAAGVALGRAGPIEASRPFASQCPVSSDRLARQGSPLRMTDPHPDPLLIHRPLATRLFSPSGPLPSDPGAACWACGFWAGRHPTSLWHAVNEGVPQQAIRLKPGARKLRCIVLFCECSPILACRYRTGALARGIYTPAGPALNLSTHSYCVIILMRGG